MGRARIVCAIFMLLGITKIGLSESKFLTDQVGLNQSEVTYASNYPIILHHGVFGFKKILILEYFYKVPDTLRNLGYEVFVTKVDPIGSIAERARQLGAQIDEIRRITGKDKVNIIAHSMGGLDSRFLISELGYQDKIASVSMISTPNRGSYIADIVVSAFDAHKKVREAVLSLIGAPQKKGILAKAIEAVSNNSVKFLTNFNKRISNHSAVYYQSWAGVTSARSDKGASKGDRVGPLFYIPYWILKHRTGNNDGLVTVDSARWGHYRGMIPADHLDQVGFWWGATSPKYRHLLFFQKIASELARKGF
ncbi:MAG: alpha/beta fold hydrolase [Oligoflexales bacterium]|nr:alpha/beta fold hydrolase [Oligoflexales bacterium]